MRLRGGDHRCVLDTDWVRQGRSDGSGGGSLRLGRAHAVRVPEDGLAGDGAADGREASRLVQDADLLGKGRRCGGLESAQAQIACGCVASRRLTVVDNHLGRVREEENLEAGADETNREGG